LPKVTIAEEFWAPPLLLGNAKKVAQVSVFHHGNFGIFGDS
jgi:hypothetical protein